MAPTSSALAPAPDATSPSPSRRRIADGPTDAEVLSRPEKQWRWIREATDDTCRARLRDTAARFIGLPDRDEPNGNGCGIPRAVALIRGATGVRYQPAIRVDCSFALRLGEIETLMHEEAEARFGARVRAVGTIGSYACRDVRGRLRGWSGGISEHSFGNAVDVTHFDLDDGQRISVARHYPRDRKPAARPPGAFLRRVVARVWDEADMRALSPDFDRSHAGHLHFDAGSRWWRRGR
ncbi:MAG: extensin family protein [Myxococcota bacterium]